MPTKDDIKEWLTNSNLTREWLGEKVGTSKRTVDNWLSSPIEIPPRKLATIRELMLAPAPATAPLQNLVIEMTPEEFDAMEAAAREKGGVRAWALQALIKASMDEDLPNVVPMVPTTAEEREEVAAHWLDLIGGVAAGAQISSDVIEKPIPVGRDYPDDHYALQVFGQSMEPKIPDGSIIVVQKWREGFPAKGKIVIYSDGMGSTLKEFGYRKARADEEANNFGQVPVLRSLNKAFPDVQTMENGKIDAVFVETL